MKVESTGRQDKVFSPTSEVKATTSHKHNSSSLSTRGDLPPGEKLTRQLNDLVEWCKELLYWIYDSFVWIVEGCPPEETPTDFLEEIIERPKEFATDFAQKAVPCFADLIISVLLDPHGIRELRNQNKREIGDFIRAYHVRDSNWRRHFQPRKGFELEKTLYDGLYRNPSLLQRMLHTFQQDLVSILGEKDKPGDTVQIQSLRRIANGYLAKIVTRAENNPKLLVNLHKELRTKKLNAFTATIKKHATPGPSSKEEGDLLRVFEKDALVLKQLEDPRRFWGKEYEGASSIDFSTYINRGYLAHMRDADFKTLSSLIGEYFPLLKSVVQRAKALSSEEKQLIVRQLPNSLKLLKELRKDLDHPPRSKN